jgi:hypothetical protein
MNLNEQHLTRAHEKEIAARPKKTWFQSEGDKQKLKQMSNAQVNGVDLMAQVEEVAPKLAKVKVKADVKRDPYAGMTRKKRRRLIFAKEAAATKAENDAKGVKTLDHGVLICATAGLSLVFRPHASEPHAVKSAGGVLATCGALWAAAVGLGFGWPVLRRPAAEVGRARGQEDRQARARRIDQQADRQEQARAQGCEEAGEGKA